MKYHPPDCPRALFNILGNLPAQGRIEEFLKDIDWTAVTPHQIYHGIFGRLPESAAVAIAPEGYAAATHALAAICSPEFQSDVINRILLAYPEKRRLIFIHVPKCAGTDLILTLSEQYPCLHESLSDAAWTGPDQFFASLANLARRIVASDGVLVTGHVPLTWFVERQLCRFHDRLFTIVRHPFDIAISQVNYLFKRLGEVPNCEDPDTRAWADAIGIDDFQADWPQETIRTLALKAFRSPEIVCGNYLCTFLGQGDAETACDLLFRCKVELTDVDRYDQWRRERWGVSADARANVSRPVLTADMLSPEDLKHFHAAWAQDLILFQRIQRVLDRSGRSAICGSELLP